MEGLCFDLLIKIFSKLDVCSLSIAAVVCTRWNDVCSNDMLWHWRIKRLEHYNFSNIALTQDHVKKLEVLTKLNLISMINWNATIDSFGIWSDFTQTEIDIIVAKLWIALLFGARKTRDEGVGGMWTYNGFVFFVNGTGYARLRTCCNLFKNSEISAEKRINFDIIRKRLSKIWELINTDVAHIDDLLQTDKWFLAENQLLVYDEGYNPSLQQQGLLDLDESNSLA